MVFPRATRLFKGSDPILMSFQDVPYDIGLFIFREGQN